MMMCVLLLYFTTVVAVPAQPRDARHVGALGGSVVADVDLVPKALRDFTKKAPKQCIRDYGKCYSDRDLGSQCTPLCCECKVGLLCQNGDWASRNSGRCKRVNGKMYQYEDGCKSNDDCAPELHCVRNAHCALSISECVGL